MPINEIIRRAVARRYDDREGLLAALDASYAAWTTRDFDGQSYVEGLRRGFESRIA